MGQIAVFAKLTAKAGQRDALLEAMQPLIQCALDEEPGTVTYAVHTMPDDEDAIWLYEVFDGQDGLQTHAANETRLKAVGDKVGTLLAGPLELAWGRPVHQKGFSTPAEVSTGA